MLEKTVEINGFIEESGKTTSFHVKIHPPKINESGSYYCLIESTDIFTKPMHIFGVDEKQAAELSLNLVRSILSDRKIVDEHGNKLEF